MQLEGDIFFTNKIKLKDSLLTKTIIDVKENVRAMGII